LLTKSHLTWQLRGDGKKDRTAAGDDGVDAGDGRTEIRRLGREGRRGIREMH